MPKFAVGDNVKITCTPVVEHGVVQEVHTDGHIYSYDVLDHDTQTLYQNIAESCLQAA